MTLLAVVATPLPVNVTDWPSPDPNAATALNVSEWTLGISVVALIIAFFAAKFTYQALRKTQQQLDILLRQPNVELGLTHTQPTLPLGQPLDAHQTVDFNGNKRYTLVLAVLNNGQIEAENYRVSVVMKQGQAIAFSNEKPLNYLPLLSIGATYSDANGIYDEWFIEGRAIQVTTSPIALAQISFYTNQTNLPVEITLSCACSGGNFFEVKQLVTFH